VLFGVGKLLLHETAPGLLLLALAALGCYVIYRDLFAPRLGYRGGVSARSRDRRRGAGPEGS